MVMYTNYVELFKSIFSLYFRSKYNMIYAPLGIGSYVLCMGSVGLVNINNHYSNYSDLVHLVLKGISQ